MIQPGLRTCRQDLLPHCIRRPAEMGSRTHDKGETASLKKRKREQKDEASPSIKRHRAKSKLEHDRKANEGKANEEDSRPDNALVQKVNGDIESSAESVLTKPQATGYAAVPWKLSKPMGGRILDIDPMLSPDEKLVSPLIDPPVGTR